MALKTDDESRVSERRKSSSDHKYVANILFSMYVNFIEDVAPAGFAGSGLARSYLCIVAQSHTHVHWPTHGPYS